MRDRPIEIEEICNSAERSTHVDPDPAVGSRRDLVLGIAQLAGEPVDRCRLANLDEAGVSQIASALESELMERGRTGLAWVLEYLKGSDPRGGYWPRRVVARLQGPAVEFAVEELAEAALSGTDAGWQGVESSPVISLSIGALAELLRVAPEILDALDPPAEPPSPSGSYGSRRSPGVGGG